MSDPLPPPCDLEGCGLPSTIDLRFDAGDGPGGRTEIRLCNTHLKELLATYDCWEEGCGQPVAGILQDGTGAAYLLCESHLQAAEQEEREKSLLEEEEPDECIVTGCLEVVVYDSPTGVRLCQAHLDQSKAELAEPQSRVTPEIAGGLAYVTELMIEDRELSLAQDSR